MYNSQNIEQLDFNQILNLIKSGEISFYNFYNCDIPINQHFGVEYYLNHPMDVMDLPQKIKIGFTDIELYNPNDYDFDFNSADLPINAITITDSLSKHYYAFYLLQPINIEKFGININDPNFDYNSFIVNVQDKIKDILVKYKYLDDDCNLTILLFNQEEDLLKGYWSKLKDIDPCILSGWNSDLFDYPYLYFRTVKLFGLDASNKMMTNFGHVTNKGDLVSFPEYTILDLLYAYKPRDEGGLNLGRKQSSYTLDNISKIVLGMNKIEYKTKNVSLNELYENDPFWFLIYNIADAALTLLLNTKLKHIELYNSIRRVMRSGFNASTTGSSVIFDSFVYSKLIERQQFVRYGINIELRKQLDDVALSNIPKLIDQKGKVCESINVDARTYSDIVSRFPGALNWRTLNSVNSGNILTSNVEDNPEPSLNVRGRCNDYSERKYTQVSGSTEHIIFRRTGDFMPRKAINRTNLRHDMMI